MKHIYFRAGPLIGESPCLLKAGKRSFESIAGHPDPIYECDDIENVWIFVTNIVNLQVNFGKSP